MEKPYLSVVIPAYNEERNIERTVKQIHQFLTEGGYSFEIIVVDDGSSDSTVTLAEKLLPVMPQLNLLKNHHRGKGFTVRTGILSAKGSLVLFVDADGSTPIREVKRLFLWLTDHSFDIAIASREGPGAKREQEPYYRHLMGRVFNYVVQILALPGIKDSQCGFKLFKEEVAKKIFSHLSLYGEESPEIPFAYTGAFDVEVLFLARRLGYKIKEVPVSWIYNRTERVHPLRDSWRMFKDVVKIRLNAVRGVYSVQDR